MTNRIKHTAKIRTKRKPARQYDPKIGRFLSVDPMWESFPNYNPYHYCYNNPVSFKDPTGLAPEGEKEDEIQSKQKEDELQNRDFTMFGGVEMDINQTWGRIMTDLFPNPSELGLVKVYHCFNWTTRSFFTKEVDYWGAVTVTGGGLGSSEGGGSLVSGPSGGGGGNREGSSDGSTTGLNTNGDLAQNGTGNAAETTTSIRQSVEVSVESVKQQTANTCWYACFKSILKTFNMDSDANLELLDSYLNDADGIKPTTVKVIGEKLGLNVEELFSDVLSKRLSKSQIESKLYNTFTNNSVQAVGMIAYNYKNNEGHMMLIHGMNYSGGKFQSFQYMDPYKMFRPDIMGGKDYLWDNQGKKGKGIGICFQPSDCYNPNEGSAFYFIITRGR